MESKYWKIDSTFLSRNINNIQVRKVKDVINDKVHHYDFFIEEHNLHGVGTSRSEEIAFLKAQNETIERLCLIYAKDKHNKIKTSNGFAAHSTLEEAKRSAFIELIERDLFFTSWLTNRKPQWETDFNDDYILEAIGEFSNKGIKLQLGIIGKSCGIYCVISSLTPIDFSLDFGCSIALGSSSSLMEAFKEVILDQYRMGTLIVNSINKLESFSMGITENQIQKPIDQLHYYLDPANAMRLSKYFSESDQMITLPNIEDINYETFILPPEITFPVKVTRCFSDEVQSYFTGKTAKSSINYKRIRNLINEDEGVNMCLHPFG